MKSEVRWRVTRRRAESGVSMGSCNSVNVVLNVATRKIEAAILETVKKVRRLLRSRLRSISLRNFMVVLPFQLSGQDNPKAKKTGDRIQNPEVSFSNLDSWNLEFGIRRIPNPESGRKKDTGHGLWSTASC